jgi:hypothetical protein
MADGSIASPVVIRPERRSSGGELSHVTVKVDHRDALRASHHRSHPVVAPTLMCRVALLASTSVGLDGGRDGSGAARQAGTAGDDHATMLRRNLTTVLTTSGGQLVVSSDHSRPPKRDQEPGSE